MGKRLAGLRPFTIVALAHPPAHPLPHSATPPLAGARAVRIGHRLRQPATPGARAADAGRRRLRSHAHRHDHPEGVAARWALGLSPAALRPDLVRHPHRAGPARHAQPRRAVLPAGRRQHRPRADGRAARCGRARRARAPAGGRPLHHRRRRPAAGPGQLPERGGAPVQPVPRRARQRPDALRRLGLRLCARQPAHAQQALRGRQRRRRGGRAQHGRRVRDECGGQQLRRHGRVRGRAGGARPVRRVRPLLEQRGRLPVGRIAGTRSPRRSCGTSSTRWWPTPGRRRRRAFRRTARSTTRSPTSPLAAAGPRAHDEPALRAGRSAS
jgi:hypothetical protein